MYIVMGVLISIRKSGTNKDHTQEWSAQGSQLEYTWFPIGVHRVPNWSAQGSQLEYTGFPIGVHRFPNWSTQGSQMQSVVTFPCLVFT